MKALTILSAWIAAILLLALLTATVASAGDVGSAEAYRHLRVEVGESNDSGELTAGASVKMGAGDFSEAHSHESGAWAVLVLTVSLNLIFFVGLRARSKGCPEAERRIKRGNEWV